jgi:hypothetical protein
MGSEGSPGALAGFSTFTRGVIAEILEGYSRGTRRVLDGRSTGTRRVLEGYSCGTRRVLEGYSTAPSGGTGQAAGGKSERERRALATREKEKGNEAFKAKEYKEAVVCARPAEHTHTRAHARAHAGRVLGRRNANPSCARTRTHTHVRRHRLLGP